MPPGRPPKNREDVLLKSAEVIGWALGGIEREIAQTRERLATLTSQAAALRSRVGGGTPKPAAPAAAPAPTQATRSEAAAGGDAAGERKRRRRKMSAEARRRISENLKKRWAETKKAGKTRLQAAR